MSSRSKGHCFVRRAPEGRYPWSSALLPVSVPSLVIYNSRWRSECWVTNPYFACPWVSQSCTALMGVPYEAPARLRDRPQTPPQGPHSRRDSKSSDQREDVPLQYSEPRWTQALISDLVLVSASKHRPSISEYRSSTAPLVLL